MIECCERCGRLAEGWTEIDAKRYCYTPCFWKEAASRGDGALTDWYVDEGFNSGRCGPLSIRTIVAA